MIHFFRLNFSGGLTMRILLVEDDRNLCTSLAYQLTDENIETDICSDGEEALYYIEQNIYDLILLDRMLPSMDGITVLQKMRSLKYMTPVIMLTALGELSDKITGLDAGADDYLVKPFAFAELMARIRSIARRPYTWNHNSEELHFNDIHYKSDEKMLSGPSGVACTLSKRESNLLEFFIRNHNQVLPRTILLNKVWGLDSEIEEGNLDNYIHFLRRRLRTVKSATVIKTKRGVGYCMEEADV